MTRIKGVDFMAVGAHPDDVELGAGGTLLKLKKAGRKGVLIDMTDGGTGTRGSADERAKEARAAAKVLGVERVCLGLPDARIEDDWEARKSLIRVIREYRPKIMVTHSPHEEHPDHIRTATLVKECLYLAGLTKLDVPGKPHRPERLFQFMGLVHFEPTFCVDISDFWKEKMKLIDCYQSQFFGKAAANFAGKTDLSQPGFLEHLTVRHRYWGGRIKRTYAEPFRCAEMPEIDDITALGGARFA